MRRTNRNRSNYRSTALCIISAVFLIALLAVVPATANSAEFFLSEDGKTLSVNATLTEQSSYTLVKQGFLFQDEALSVNDLVILDADGNTVDYTVSKSTVTFPKGDYTLTYTQNVSDNLIYAKFPDVYEVKVYLPAKYATGHVVLGTVGSGGTVSVSDNPEYKTLVTYPQTKTVEVKFYEDGREVWLYGFLGIWLVVLIIVYARYRSLKNRRLNAGRKDE